MAVKTWIPGNPKSIFVSQFGYVVIGLFIGFSLHGIISSRWQRSKSVSGTNKNQVSRLVIIPLSGRLGNQMFQYAAGVHAGRKTGRIPAFIANTYSSETDFSTNLFRNFAVVPSVPSVCGHEEVQRLDRVDYSCTGSTDGTSLIISKELLQSQRRCVVLPGLFQCASLADHVARKTIRAAVQDTRAFGQATRIINRWRKRWNVQELVAVHVRRGDYTKRFNKGLLEPLLVRYYVRAFEYLKEKLHGRNVLFVVFSDDVAWCKQNFRELTERGYKVIYADVEDPLTALLAMALCEHNIIANSTFSWWAAFLNENTSKVVCAPSKWFGHRIAGQRLNIVPETWIRLDGD